MLFIVAQDECIVNHVALIIDNAYVRSTLSPGAKNFPKISKGKNSKIALFSSNYARTIHFLQEIDIS
jgi:hypothetical protein